MHNVWLISFQDKGVMEKVKDTFMEGEQAVETQLKKAETFVEDQTGMEPWWVTEQCRENRETPRLPNARFK